MCRQTNSKYSAATAQIKKTITDWLNTLNTWPSDEQIESFRASSFPPPCPTFYKQGSTSQNALDRLRSVSVSVRLKELEQAAEQQMIRKFWNDHRQYLLPLAKTSEDDVMLRKSQALLKLPSKHVDKFWHKFKCDWILTKGEDYRLGLMNCHVCKQSMAKIIGGKCTLPGHKDISAAKKRKTLKDAEAKKRADEQPISVSCAKCKCTLILHPKTKKIVDITQSKRCQVNGHHNLDPAHLRFNEHGVCDACNGLAGITTCLFACWIPTHKKKHTYNIRSSLCNLFMF